MKIASRYVFLLLMIFVLSHCVQIKYSTSGASIPAGAKTFSVQPFENNAPLINPQLSQQLTDALREKMEAQTSLKPINGFADLDYAGLITGYDVRPVAIQGDDLAAKNRLTITIKLKFTNAFDSKYEFDKSFSRYEDFDGNQDLKQVEDNLVPLIIDKLVQDIFNESVVNW
jgi:outer membrane receptor for Fe3+-dicitrate